jgi:hypothetical protein
VEKFSKLLCCLLKNSSAAASAKRCALLSVEQRIFILKEKKVFHTLLMLLFVPSSLFQTTQNSLSLSLLQKRHEKFLIAFKQSAEARLKAPTTTIVS